MSTATRMGRRGTGARPQPRRRDKIGGTGNVTKEGAGIDNSGGKSPKKVKR